MSPFFRTTPLALVATLLIAPHAHAATYYVDSANGVDGTAGTQGAPWETLQYAADTVTAGDIVIVLAGTYAGFELTTSGSSTARISFEADPGVTVTGEMNLEGASYVTIQGFEITGSNRAGIRAVECQHVWLLGNRAYQNFRWGIFTGCCADLLIEGNECSESEDEHGIYVSNSGDRPTIRGNELWGNNANGVHMNGDASISCNAGFIDNDGVISNAVVEQNTIYGNGAGGGSGINCDGVSDSYFANNLVYTTHASGMSLYQIDAGAPSTDNLVVNNTIVVADDGRWAMNIQDASTGNTLWNNVLLTFHPSRGSIDISADSLTGLVSDYNVVTDTFSEADNWISLSEWQASTGQDQNSILSDPATVFADAANDDYQLSTTSPARDTGSATNAPNVDLIGNARPVGSAIDIGAYEYCEGTQCNTTPENCTNGTDDDGDGDTDCDDSDCANAPSCQPAVEDCTNGTDDDGDGDADCDDSDCAAEPSCQPGAENCTNGTDDDGDGDIDCDDSDCANATACQPDPDPEICDNGVDDDGDGDTDCDDTDCSTLPECGSGDEDSGCGCRTSERTSGLFWLLLLTAWLGLRRQRRKAPKK
ncbi:MAG: right-handed parallel beta-helix repeat-containing protein [bacterium]